MPGVKGQSQRRGVARKQAILAAATEVFAAQGYRGGSLASIAERVGLTAAGILRHFESKEALLLAVIEHRDARAAAISAELEPLPALDMIKGLVRFAEFSEAERGVAALFIVLQAEHFETDGDVRAFFLRRNQFVRRMIASAVRRGQRDGSIRAAVDARKVSAELVAFMDGAAFMWLLDPELSLVALYEGYLERLVDWLAVKGDGQA